MKIEQQVCSLELAKKLDALGVKKDSVFVWGECDGEIDLYFKENSRFGEGVAKLASAFTVAELGEMLPMDAIDSEVINYFPTKLQIDKGDSGWYVYYKNISEPDINGEIDTDEDIETKDYQNNQTLADAMAKMLIYLIENKLQTISDK